MNQVENTITALTENGMLAFFVESKKDACDKVFSMITKDEIIGVGGSVTLMECGIHDRLRDEKFQFLDWIKPLPTDEKEDILKKTLTADVFLTSSNAITQDGKLYNVDGRGNRVAAMVYGPKKVIVVAGVNKIVKDLNEADIRMKTIAAPLNTKKLNKNTPCVNTGRCMDCKSDDRICRHYLITDKQKSDRITVIIVNEKLGF